MTVDCPVLAYFHPQPVVGSLSFSPHLSSCSNNNAGVLLLDVEEYKSPNFLQTSERLRTQWISL